jgi:hypothetical protein
MSELITNIVRMGLPQALLHALQPRPASMQVPIAKEAPAPVAAPVIDRGEPDAGDSADRQLHEQLRTMAALHHARTAQQG